MHIMHVIDSLAVGGAERMLVELANRTAADGHLVSVCITRSGEALASALTAGIPLHVLRRSRRFDQASLRAFGGLVRASRPDVLHAHSRWTFSFVAAAKSLRLVQEPVVLHDHFGGIERDASIPAWFRYWGRRQVAVYVGVCEKLADWARRSGLPAKKVAVIDNALDLRRLAQQAPVDVRSEFGISSKTLVGVFVGGIREDKGLDLLVEAAAQLREVHPFKLLVVGGFNDGKFSRMCRDRVRDLGLCEAILFLGVRNDVAGLLHSVDFAVHPARSESGPLVLLEYMTCGVPFVATRVGDIGRRVAALGVPGFVEPGSATALAMAWRELLSLDADVRRERGARGREVARRYFEISGRMPQWYRAYETAAGRVLQ